MGRLSALRWLSRCRLSEPSTRLLVGSSFWIFSRRQCVLVLCCGESSAWNTRQRIGMGGWPIREKCPRGTNSYMSHCVDTAEMLFNSGPRGLPEGRVGEQNWQSFQKRLLQISLPALNYTHSPPLKKDRDKWKCCLYLGLLLLHFYAFLFS